jgi:hypothetical protein
MRTTLLACCVALITTAAPGGVALAQGDDDWDAWEADAQQSRDRRERAIEQAVEFLRQNQEPDGSWSYVNQPFRLPADDYPMSQGVTALCALALLKAGVAPDDEALERAFEFIHGQELRWTYAASCVLLALEAKTNFRPRDPDGEGTRTRRRNNNRADRRDLALARQCVQFLEQHQGNGLWRYPHSHVGDLSNTQYAMLALDAAERLGVDVDKDLFRATAARLVDAQEQDGPEVAWFAVPGADRRYAELREIQEQLEGEIRDIERAYRRMEAEERDDEGYTQEERVQTAERNAGHTLTANPTTGERPPAMRARGWSYLPRELHGGAGRSETTPSGSMTASGLACLFICKAHLEGDRSYQRELSDPVDAALRDGAAWLARNFSVSQNPGVNLHHLYYLYSLERAGILGLIPQFGGNDWYAMGTDVILARQRGGSFNAGVAGTAGPIPDTCFGLLFLTRGTTPVVEVPERVMTGTRER